MEFPYNTFLIRALGCAYDYEFSIHFFVLEVMDYVGTDVYSEQIMKLSLEILHNLVAEKLVKIIFINSGNLETFDLPADELIEMIRKNWVELGEVIPDPGELLFYKLTKKGEVYLDALPE